MTTTPKSTKTRYDAKRALCINAVAKEYDVTGDYVRKALSGTAKGGQTEEIIRSYNAKYQAISKHVA